ncbi:hypothetical protein ES703_96687 [subsurface metagenome]
MVDVEDERMLKTIMMGGAQADLLTAVGPGYAKPGDSITLGIEVKNIGELADQIWTQIYDGDTYELVKNFNKYMDSGEVWEWTEPFTMPDKDWNLVYRVGHFEAGEAVMDDSGERKIVVGTPLWDVAMIIGPIIVGTVLVIVGSR